MLKTGFVAVAFTLMMAVPTAMAQDYSVEVLNEAPDSDDVPAGIKEQLAGQGYKVQRGSRTVCEVWLAKQWPIDGDFEETQDRLYPFTPGQLLGVLHFSRRGNDFRDQSISSGWYTLRFALQPIDGNHVGTSLTRDFVVLVEAAQDAADKDWDTKELMLASAAAAGSTHPAMLCLQKAAEGDGPAVRHNEEHDWWILHVKGKGVAGDQTKDLPLDVIVVGLALE